MIKNMVTHVYGHLSRCIHFYLPGILIVNFDLHPLSQQIDPQC